MDYRDTEELYAKKEERLARKQKHSEDTKDVIAKAIALSVTFFLFAVMISQLASCSAPPPVDDYEKHQIAYEEYAQKTDLRGTPYARLLDMWDTVWIEAMINLENN